VGQNSAISGHIMPNNSLIQTLVELPQRELMDVIARALEQRTADVARPEWEEAKLCLAEVHRFHEGSNQPGPWEVLLVARPRDAEPNDAQDFGASQEGAHCGHTLIGYEKQAICPICWQPAELT
jgi:hypothetical protein